jgi:DNA polymerase-3 subunit delta
VEEGPSIYIFDGDDEFAINESIAKIHDRLGDATIAGMNTTRLDGRSYTLPQLADAVATVPFLAPKRLVILTFPTARLLDRQHKESLIDFLNTEKPTAKLILVSYDFLTIERDRRENRLHWLEKWALSPEQSKRVYLRHHAQPSGALMVRWIQDHAKSLGGQFTPQAAVSLASLVGNDTGNAAQEVAKLLTYVNFARAVDADDVEHLTPLTARVGDFDLVNALRDRDGRKAGGLLQRSLEEDDPLRIFQGIVYQIRTLIIAREIVDDHGTVDDFPKSLKIGYFPAKLAMESVHRYPGKFLDDIYHRLLELDEDIKTGRMDADLALELLVIKLTA